MYPFSQPVTVSLVMLFDTAKSVTANCEPCRKDVRKAQEQCCHLVVEVSLA